MVKYKCSIFYISPKSTDFDKNGKEKNARKRVKTKGPGLFSVSETTVAGLFLVSEITGREGGRVGRAEENGSRVGRRNLAAVFLRHPSGGKRFKKIRPSGGLN